jgi:ankyrin repeat protein
VDAVVYEIGPVRQALEEESQGLEILGQGNAPMAEPNPMGETALHQAARCPIHSTGVGDGPNPVLRSLLALGFRVNALDARGRTPLHVARGACNILDLLRAGADTLAVDVRGMRAIDVVMARPEGPQACAMYERGLLCGSSMVSTVSRTKIRL